MGNYIKNNININAVNRFLKDCEDNQIDLHMFTIHYKNEEIVRIEIPPYCLTQRPQLYSLSKSVTSLAVGLCVQEGRFQVDDFAADFFQEELKDCANEKAFHITIKDLLTMRSGHKESVMSKMFSSSNAVKTFFDTPLDYKPGEHFVYNTGATYILSAIISKVTGMTMLEYLKPKLFDVLGIKNVSWRELQGVTEGGIGIQLTCEDYAKIGLLYFNYGCWEGKQVIERKWVEDSIRPWADTSVEETTADWTAGYGYQIWCDSRGGYRAAGAFGQFCLISQQHEMVVTLFSETNRVQEELTLLYQLLDTIFYVDSDVKATELRISQKQLFMPIKRRIEEEHYICETNIYDIKEFLIRKEENRLYWKIKSSDEEQTILAVDGKWERCHLRLPNLKPYINPFKTDVDEYMDFYVNAGELNGEMIIQWRHIDNCHYQKFIFHRRENGIELEMVCNQGLHFPDNYVIRASLRSK